MALLPILGGIAGGLLLRSLFSGGGVRHAYAAYVLHAEI